MAVTHEITIDPQVYHHLLERCVEIFCCSKPVSPTTLALFLMDCPDVPIHYPYHHFILPASLITATCLASGDSEETLRELLNEALKRSFSVPGGFCGNYGACGAAVGAGLALSVYTGTTPLSDIGWQWCNELTGLCLQKISTVPGPRCCKRTCFFSLQTATPYFEEKLDLHFPPDDPIVCSHSQRNTECKGALCPFYPTR